MARHFLNLDGARTLPTESLKMVDHAIADLIAAQAMGAIHGPAGLGKTFAVETTLHRHATGGAGAPTVVWASFPSRPTMRLVAATLLSELTGVPAGRRDRFALTAMLLEELAGPNRVLVIDEAQRLNTDCIELLRHLHDHPLTSFTLLLVGGDGTWQVLSREPMLRSRIYRRVGFVPLAAAQVGALIPTFHPIYADVDAELVVFIDDQFAHGNLRDWAAFTHSAALLCATARRERVDEEIARNVFTLHGGGTRA
ncbi:MAG: AAA family ATPase [Pseudonocardia sp.]